MLFWRLVNPLNRRLAPIAPWWVVLETTGRRSGQPRHTPLARGPREGNVTWLISVHGRTADWVRNVEANPTVRLRIDRRWHHARAAVHPFDPAIVSRFNRYARGGPALMGIEPVLVRIELVGSAR